ncbi:MAG: PQQ-dependent sugar dehydrogenase [Candidatus Eiseniibacteriota bacterium]
MKNRSELLIVALIFTSILIIISWLPYRFSPAFARAKTSLEGPVINDTHLTAQLLVRGLKAPSAMSFLGPNDILVTEKNTGNLMRVVNGVILQQPLLHVAANKKDERGLLGLAISETENRRKHIFLYYTEANLTESGKVSPVPLGNRVYRYEFVGDKLVNPKLLLDLPAFPGPRHNAGKIAIGLDNNLYVSIGDVDGSFRDTRSETKAQNYDVGPSPDGRAGILRITQDGKTVGKGILGDTPMLNYYYAYGIKNSFGFDFDPITKKLWDSENGPTYGDEINLVEPGFNSGWVKIQGIWKTQIDSTAEPERGPVTGNSTLDLVNFGGKGKYRPPEFTWSSTVAPTAVRFLTTDKLGQQYKNDMFVADVKYGNIYHFKLNSNRTGFILNGSLADKVASGEDNTEQIEFASGFGGITDLEIGPDGSLYVLVFDKEDGKIYKITPTG